jgi:hypothetical protein
MRGSRGGLKQSIASATTFALIDWQAKRADYATTNEAN